MFFMTLSLGNFFFEKFGLISSILAPFNYLKIIKKVFRRVMVIVSKDFRYCILKKIKVLKYFQHLISYKKSHVYLK